MFDLELENGIGALAASATVTGWTVMRTKKEYANQYENTRILEQGFTKVVRPREREGVGSKW